MPKVGMEPIRRKNLIDATIQTIYERGFCDVTVAQIAKRAGVSSALAHHYFGSKDQLLNETMRHLMRDLSTGIANRLKNADTPRARISAIIEGNFTSEQFRETVITAWLAFYVQARTNPASQRLLHIYSARLRSNLTFNLCAFMSRSQALLTAESVAALIDGVWLRQVLSPGICDRNKAIVMVESHVHGKLLALQSRS